MNEHDSENIAGLLEAIGYNRTDDAMNADLVIMNTCSVRENADKRFFGVLGQFKKRKQNDKNFIMCVCGCMPQQPRIVEKIKKEFSWVDIIFGTQNISKLPELLENRIKSGKKQYEIIDNNPTIEEENLNPVREYEHKALVNITYGCNNFCTYCIVPYTRGREKSRRLEDIVNEIKKLAKDGVKEIMLLGQNVDSYIDIEGKDFADLLLAINDIDGIERIRFMTSHPKDISTKMMKCFNLCNKLCNHIHLPVQSGSNDVLKRMNRHYDIEKYLKIISELRSIKPDISISTDIIVGFPGETEEDFEQTLEVVRNVKYDSAFTFIYSPREGTPAAKFTDQIPEEVKHKRFNRLVDLINEISLEINSKMVGQTVDVLVDGYSKNDETKFSGRTLNNKLVNFKSDGELCDLTGEIVKVKILESKTFSLDGVKIV